jgi:6-phosphogluconolactonase (cycloisomerase 2 family)
MAKWRVVGLLFAAALAGCHRKLLVVYVVHGALPAAISAFSTNDLINGGLTRIHADATNAQVLDVPAGNGDRNFMAVHPSGKYLYVTNDRDSTVSAYSVGAAGRLTRMDADPTTAVIDDFATGGNPLSVAVHPNGKFVYVVNSIIQTPAAPTTNGTITTFEVDPNDGTLYRRDNDPLSAPIDDLPAGWNPYLITVEPKGRFAYVGRWDPAPSSIPPGWMPITRVSAYLLDASGGLTRVDADPHTSVMDDIVFNGDGPQCMAITPNGKFLYVGNIAGAPSPQLLGFSIDPATGALSHFGDFNIEKPWSIAIDPAGKIAHVAVDGTQSAFTSMRSLQIDPTTGALTLVNANPPTPGTEDIPTDRGFRSITIDPTGRFVFLDATDPILEEFLVDPATGRLRPAAAHTTGGHASSRVSVAAIVLP